MPIEKKYEESTLLVLLSQDSEYAFQLVFDRYRNTIYKVSMMYVKSPVIAEEIVQDVFLKLWFHRHNLTEIRSLESWLFVLAKNLALNSIRKIAHEWTARQKWVRQSDPAADRADAKLISAENNELMKQAVQRLSPHQQEVFTLAREQGLSYDDIAKKLCMSRLTVKTHMARALNSIRRFLYRHGVTPLLFIIAVLQ